MSQISDLAKALVPKRFRPFLREQHRRFVFWRAMRRFLEDPQRAANDGAVLTDLIYGWGNEVWSALEEYLKACLEVGWQAKGPILECGSGLSTLLLGVAAQRTGNVVWTLEHNATWGERVKRYLSNYGIDSVHLYVDALRDYGDFCWYNPPLDSIPNNFSVVICDGPPGDTRGGRFGLLPIMKPRLSRGCVILLDDAARADEQVILRRWAAELNTEYQIHGSMKLYARLTVPEVEIGPR